MSQDIPLERNRTLDPDVTDTSLSTNMIHFNSSRYSGLDDMELGSIHTNLDDHENVDDSAQLKVDPNIIDWNGPNDPANPQNWSKSTRIGHVALISIITLIA